MGYMKVSDVESEPLCIDTPWFEEIGTASFVLPSLGFTRQAGRAVSVQGQTASDEGRRVRFLCKNEMDAQCLKG